MFTTLEYYGRYVATKLRSRFDSEAGTTAVEYALMAALVAAVIIVAVLFLSGKLKEEFSCVGNSITTESNQC